MFGSQQVAFDLVLVVAFAALALVLMGAGVTIELTALSDLTAGETILGLWEGAFGALLLYAGVYLVGYRQVWDRAHATFVR